MVPNTTTAVQYLCNGISTQFGFPNKLFLASDLTITLISGLGTTAQVNYSFTYLGNNQFTNATLGLTATVSNVDVDSGSLVTFGSAPTNLLTLDLRSNVPETQSTSIKNQGQFLPDLHEEAFDRYTREIQDLRRLTYIYGIHAADIETNPWPPLPSPISRAGLALIFDPVTGLPTVGAPIAQTITSSVLSIYGLDSGAANAYVFTHTGAFPVTRTAGMLLRFVPANSNTAASTLNADGTGVVAIVGESGLPVTGGELSSAGPVLLQYNGTAWQIVATAGAQLGYNITGAEAAAIAISVANRPVNFQKLPGNVDRYATNTTPGVTSMVAAFNAAIAQCQQAGGAEVTAGDTGRYLLDAPVNCTFTGGGNQRGITIRWTGGSSLDVGHGILARHSGVAVFDCTGCDGWVAYDLPILTDIPATVFPKTGVLWARNAAGGSQFNRMFNCRINGYFSVAPFYNYGSEDDGLVLCYFANLATGADTKTRVYTSNNTKFALVSSFTTIFSGGVSSTDHNAFGCQDYNAAGTTTADCVYVEGTCDGLHNIGGWAYSASASANGRALFYFDQATGPSDFCQIIGLKGETGTFLQRYGVLFSDDAQTPVGFAIRDCFLPNATKAIACPGVNPIFDTFYIENITEATAHGISFPGTVRRSDFRTGPTALSIGVSTNNNLTGYSEQWTITTRLNDNWRDTGIVNKSFSPGIANAANGWTTSGAITQRGKYSLSGNTANFQIVLSAATSVACSAGATIPTLPFAAFDAATCSVIDYTTGASLGTGKITGTTITLPTAITTTADVIVIEGTYFVA